MTNFKVVDSGERESFDTGSLRDTEEGKPRYDLISIPALKRLAYHMTKGAEKYGDRNWELGQPVSRFYASALRHLMSWAEGEIEEDHLAAVLFNIMGIIHMETLVQTHNLPESLLDTEIYDQIR